MSAETPEDRPLNLRDLAEEESPDVVRVALRRFRRRTAVRALWLAGLVLAALLLLPLLSTEASFAERYYASPGVPIGQTVDSGPVRVALLDARRIDPDNGGLHFFASASDPGLVSIQEIGFGSLGSRPAPGLTIERPILNGSPFPAEAFVLVPLRVEGFSPDRVFVSVTVGTGGSPGQPITVSFDLTQIEALQDFYWR